MSNAGEEQLPFAMERRKESSWPDGGGLHRVESEPPTFVSKQVAVKRPQQRKQPAIFVGNIPFSSCNGLGDMIEALLKA